jgi:hypothetical protein
MVCLSFLHYTSLCISRDKNLGEFLMLCFVLWVLCCSFLSIKIYVCTWVDLLFVNTYDPFDYLKHKLWPKERSKIKLPSWLLIIKSRESPWFTYVKVACYILLKSSWWGLQFCFRPHFNRSFEKKLWASKVLRVPISKLPSWESRDKMKFGYSPHS